MVRNICIRKHFWKKIINYLQKNKSKKHIAIILVILIPTFILLYNLNYKPNILTDILTHINTSILIFILFSIATLFNDKYTNILRFYGTNSLIILGFHIWVLIPIGRILYFILGKQNIETGITATFITMMIAIIFIRFCNTRIPRLVGKKSSSIKIFLN